MEEVIKTTIETEREKRLLTKETGEGIGGSFLDAGGQGRTIKRKNSKAEGHNSGCPGMDDCEIE